MVYVVGSLNADLTAVVPHAVKSGETLAADSFMIGPGGKGGNQAAAAAKLGARVAMVGKVGRDPFGAMLKSNLSAFGVDVTHVTECEEVTGLAMITVCRGNNRIVLHHGANYELSESDVIEGLQNAQAGDVLMVQLEVKPEVVLKALQIAKRKGMMTVLNPAPATTNIDALIENSELITPNETETEILTGIRPDCEVNVALAVKKLRSLGASNVIITLGSLGSAVAVGKEITLIPAQKVKVADTTAAGDTFVGAVAVRMQAGDDLISAAKFATCASALKITRRGATAVIPTLQEVQDAINKGMFTL